MIEEGEGEELGRERHEGRNGKIEWSKRKELDDELDRGDVRELRNGKEKNGGSKVGVIRGRDEGRNRRGER